MGSFDYTCAISGLPIHRGTDVFLVPLSPGRDGLNFGAFSRFMMAFPPIAGVYDDYGFVENLSFSPFHEACARSMGFDSAEAFTEQLKARAVKVQRFSEEVSATFCMARKDAWDAMMSLPISWSRQPNQHAQDAKTLLPAAVVDGRRILGQATALRSHPEIQNIEARLKEGFYDKSQLANLILNTYLISGLPSNTPFLEFFGHYVTQGGRDLFSGSRFLEILTLDMPEAGATESDIENALTLVGHCMLVSTNMMTVRKVWMDRDSSGPQQGENAMHWLWARELMRITDSAIEWDNGDDDLIGFEQARSARERDMLDRSAPLAAWTPKSKSL